MERLVRFSSFAVVHPCFSSTTKLIWNIRPDRVWTERQSASHVDNVFEPVKVCPLPRLRRIEEPTIGIPMNFDSLSVDHRIRIGCREDLKSSFAVDCNLGDLVGFHFQSNAEVVAPPSSEIESAETEEFVGGCSPTPCSESSYSSLVREATEKAEETRPLWELHQECGRLARQIASSRNLRAFEESDHEKPSA